MPVRALADFAIAAVDFARAESRRFRRSAVGLGLLLAMCIAGGMLVFLGFAAVLASVFLAMNEQVSQPTAALLTGLITIAFAGVLLWLTQRMAT